MECRYRGITIKVTIKDVLLTTRGILSYTRSTFNPLVILPPIIKLNPEIFDMEGKTTILGCDPNSVTVWIKQ